MDEDPLEIGSGSPAPAPDDPGRERAKQRKALLDALAAQRSIRYRLGAWWKRNRDLVIGQIISGLVAGTVVTVAGVVISNGLSTRLAADQQEQQDRSEEAAQILENMRFVRQVVMVVDGPRPLSGLDLRGASFSLDFKCAEPEGYSPYTRVCLDLSRSNLSGGTLAGSDISEADLSGSDFVGAAMLAITMDRTIAIDADFSHASFQKSSLTQNDFLGSSFSGADLHTVDLRGSVFGCSFQQCSDLSNADLSGSDLRGVDFTDATLKGSDLSDTCFDESTRWPKGLGGVVIPESSNARYCSSAAIADEKPWWARSAEDAAPTASDVDAGN